MMRAAILLLFLVVVPRPGMAQVFQLEGGGSSLFAGYGGLLNVWGNGYDASVGVGYLDGLRLGWSGRRLLGGRDTLRVGNDALPFVLETDVFTGGSAILAQGLSLQRRRGRTTLHAFAGASASAVAAPYFAANTPSRAMAYARGTHDLTRTLSLSAHGVLTERQTLLGSVRWRPTPRLATFATAGVGSNAPYAALAVDARTTRLDVKGAFAALGAGFRRASAPMPLQSELERENLQVTWRATPTLSLAVGRQHFRLDSAFRGLPARAELTQLSANGQWLGTSIAGGVYSSRAGGIPSLASSFSARREVATRLQAELYVLQVWEPQPSRVTTPVLLLRETITPRLSLLQVITRDAGRTSVNFGGTVSTGQSTLSLDYQVAHSPYRTVDPFVQTIALNARVQLGSYAVTIGSFITPDGTVHYSAQGSTFFYRGGARVGAPDLDAGSGRLERYLVSGEVLDEHGVGVDGAALEIGGELLYTDSRGRFFLRRAVARALPLRVVLDDFLVPGAYEVVRAPATVTPARAGRGDRVTIVLRRRTPPGGAGRA
jgi:hypothetical protein